MGVNRQLVRLLGAAIVMIAAYLLPSDASAHGNHDATPKVTTEIASSSESGAAPNTVAVSEDATPKKHDANRVLARAEADKPCNLGCCSGASPCCAPGLSEVDVETHSLDSVSRVSFNISTETLPGQSPEAPPRPPRTFA